MIYAGEFWGGTTWSALEVARMRQPLIRLLVCLLMSLSLVLGCDPDRTGLSGSAAATADSIDTDESGDVAATPVVSAELPADAATQAGDPAQVVSVWRKWRDQRRYRLLEACIEPAHRAAFIDTMLAVDLVLTADQEARQAIAEVLGEHRTESWDLSALGNNLGIFSNEINIISVERDGDRATLTFQVGDRLPLETAQLRAGPKGWLYAPGPGPIELAPRFRSLAMALSEVAELIRRDRPTAACSNQEFRLRIYPRLKALEQTETPDADAGE